MIEVLQFVLGSFWRFAGTVVLLYMVFQGSAIVIEAARGRKK